MTLKEAFDPAAGDLRKLVNECALMLPWLMDWAEVWHRDAGGYTASDTFVGMERCRRLVATLKSLTKDNQP